MSGERARRATPDLFRDITQDIEEKLLPVINEAVLKFLSRLSKDNEEKNHQLRDATIRIADLEAQLNAVDQARIRLQQTLDTYLGGQNALPNLIGSPYQQYVPSKEHELLQQRVDSLTKQLNEANERQKTEAQARHLLITKLRTAKSTAREWMELAAKRDPRKPKATPELSFKCPPEPSPGIENLHTDEILKIAARQIQSPLSSCDTTTVGHGQTVRGEHNAEDAKNANQHVSKIDQQGQENNNQASLHEIIPSSQQETIPTEVSKTLGYANRVIPNSANEPVVVEERPVKRRRKAKQITCFISETIRIKQEVVSPQHTVPHLETLDLDNIGEGLITSQKQQVLDLALQIIPNFKFERSLSEPPGSQLPRIHPDNEIANAERENTDPEDRSQSHPPLVETIESPSPGKRQILSPIDVNIQSLSRRGSKRSKRSKQSLQSIEKSIHMMREDGTTNIIANPKVRSTKPTKLDTTLQAVLDGEVSQALPAQKLQPVLSRFRTSKRRAEQMRTNEIGVVKMPHSTSKPEFRQSFPVTPTHQIPKQVVQSTPRQNLRSKNTTTRLRDKPKESLAISDFKINPSRNGGLDFAYGEAVYGEARKCYPGCTDSRCCGDAFRVLASTLNPTLPRPAYPASQEDEKLTDDEFLLKWHMGGTWNLELVRNMDKEERERYLLDARTRILAERHGKHRVMGNRRMTPPGYWDLDMPSSQEIKKHREESRRMERQMVEERYKEAIRGGKWLFADE